MTKPRGYVGITRDGKCLSVRIPPDKTIGPEMRGTGAHSVTFMYEKREWWLSLTDWPAVSDMLNQRYDLVFTPLAEGAIMEYVMDDKDRPGIDLYTCSAIMGLRVVSPEFVVHASWTAHLAQPGDRAYLKPMAEAYLRICRDRGFVPEVSALKLLGDK